MTLFDFFFGLKFVCIQSPFPDKYPDICQVPDDVPYSELDEISIAYVKDLPSSLREFIGQTILAKHHYNGELETIIEYLIEPVFDNPDSFLIQRFTTYQ
ncbi:MAG: hypothetical protein HC939_23850 [Pleurocapsa sp. SU_5_0]|nr:hypothetical protein [Pleurocapsa sp. SU_5_0]